MSSTRDPKIYGIQIGNVRSSKNNLAHEQVLFEFLLHSLNTNNVSTVSQLINLCINNELLYLIFSTVYFHFHWFTSLLIYVRILNILQFLRCTSSLKNIYSYYHKRAYVSANQFVRLPTFYQSEVETRVHICSSLNKFFLQSNCVNAESNYNVTSLTRFSVVKCR